MLKKESINDNNKARNIYYHIDKNKKLTMIIVQKKIAFIKLLIAIVMMKSILII